MKTAEGWTLRTPSSDVLDALSIWLEEHPERRFELSYHADFHVKKWLASLRVWDDPSGKRDIDGRGDSPHEALIDVFLLGDVPRFRSAE